MPNWENIRIAREHYQNRKANRPKQKWIWDDIHGYSLIVGSDGESVIGQIPYGEGHWEKVSQS